MARVFLNSFGVDDVCSVSVWADMFIEIKMLAKNSK